MYMVIATASYHSTFKTTPWFFPVGLIASLLANFMWLSIGKGEPNPSALMIKGLL